MEKIIEMIIATFVIYYILTTNETRFSSMHNVTLFISLLLFNLIFDILSNMCYQKPIKVRTINENIKQTLFDITAYYLLLDVLKMIPEMKMTVKLSIISFIIALITKHSNKYYNFSHI